MAIGRSLARGLGIAGTGFGLGELLMPGRFARFMGLQSSPPVRWFLRLCAVRELAVGAGLLGRKKPAPFQWLRVAGDVMDLVALRWIAMLPGSDRRRAMTAWGATVGVAALDVVGGVLSSRDDADASRAATGQEPMTLTQKPVRRAVTIDRPREAVFDYWRDLTHLPAFMEHLESVEPNGDGRSHWTAKAPMGTKVSWDAEIVSESPGEVIAWKALPGSPVMHEGMVTFRDAPGDRGTEVTVDFTYRPPAGVLGLAVAKLTGEEPEQQVAEDLRRLKQVLELGEVTESPTTAAPRSFGARPAQPIAHSDSAESTAHSAPA